MTVYLVGAGPGDPGLLTLRAAEVLGRAEVVVHDRLVEASLLDLAPPDAERVVVTGPEAGAVLAEHGRTGRPVVRLAPGDPFAGGAGGVEAQALQAAGVAFEVVPGVAPAAAVPAYAGVPLTHPGTASAFTVVTGDDPGTDWAVLARSGATLVVPAGAAAPAAVAGRLLAGGLAAETPVAAVTGGTRPEQATRRTTLAALAAAPAEAPATVVVGPVAGLDLGWYERRPLSGRSVVVTRARDQAPVLSARLRELGARVLELPAIAVADPADGGAGLDAAAAGITAGRYDWAIFTSVNAVPRLCGRLPDARAWAGTRLAAIGAATADALAGYRLVADVVPGEYVAEALLEALLAAPPPAHPGPVRALLPRAAVARPVLPAGLHAAGWEVDVVEAYRTVIPGAAAEVLAAAAAADAICFTSSSTVTNYVALAGRDRVPPVVACIGPVTAGTAGDAGLEVTVVAAEHTIPGLVQALVAALSAKTG